MTTTAYEIPTQPFAQRFSITLVGTSYVLRLTWCDPASCWILDILDTSGNLIKGGTPLITGADLLEQFAYLGIGGRLVVQSDDDPTLVPSYSSLGSTGHLYFLVDA